MVGTGSFPGRVGIWIKFGPSCSFDKTEDISSRDVALNVCSMPNPFAVRARSTHLLVAVV